jgi:hypothetical protein
MIAATAKRSGTNICAEENHHAVIAHDGKRMPTRKDSRRPIEIFQSSADLTTRMRRRRRRCPAEYDENARTDDRKGRGMVSREE